MAGATTVHTWMVAHALRRIGPFSLGKADLPYLRLNGPPGLA